MHEWSHKIPQNYNQIKIFIRLYLHYMYKIYFLSFLYDTLSQSGSAGIWRWVYSWLSSEKTRVDKGKGKKTLRGHEEENW